MIADPLRALRAAMRCDLAYMEPTYGPNRDAQAYVEVIDGVQHFAIAGTNSLVDLWHDLNFGWAHRDALGTVRRGFANAWDPFRDALNEAGPEAFGLDRGLPVVVECHSLGVPIAQYLTGALRNQMPVLYVEGFGGPTGWRRPAAYPPLVPCMIWKNGFDIVAGRPWLLGGRDGICPGTIIQFQNGSILSAVHHPSKFVLHPIVAGANHRLQGPQGYIHQLGRLAEAMKMTTDWRTLPEAARWFAAVSRWEEREAIRKATT